MRIGLGNVLTTEEHLRKAWEIIRETAEANSVASPDPETQVLNKFQPAKSQRVGSRLIQIWSLSLVGHGVWLLDSQPHLRRPSAAANFHPL